MAQSRLEKIGTIYSRVTSLLKGKAIKEEDRPIWLAIYEAFPPKYEPRYDRKLPKKPIQPIFYEEDIIRARFHKDQSYIPSTNLTDKNTKSATQNFLSMYRTIKEEEGLSENDAYTQAIQHYSSQVEAKLNLKKIESESSSSSN
ncbi:probable 28S ribosomal protein S23, mitochondrial [Pseudomyrmex gracilis]|uniref:probable 28S ribosomal protein S23, mitochondrial n=1 Tax=Pseudomyrmex gracilis TaxID=219809 RepID=UPI000994A976|nr:probable 28S ribosomal protein S23, mitochondrial [Pseudomyrmex gracilis]